MENSIQCSTGRYTVIPFRPCSCDESVDGSLVVLMSESYTCRDSSGLTD